MSFVERALRALPECVAMTIKTDGESHLGDPDGYISSLYRAMIAMETAHLASFVHTTVTNTGDRLEYDPTTAKELRLAAEMMRGIAARLQKRAEYLTHLAEAHAKA